MRVGYNERKKQILKLLDGQEMTAKDVAEETGISEHTARHHLLRYWRENLLIRSGGEFVPGTGNNPYLYTTSDNGRNRLEIIETKPYQENKNFYFYFKIDSDGHTRMTIKFIMLKLHIKI